MTALAVVDFFTVPMSARDTTRLNSADLRHVPLVDYFAELEKRLLAFGIHLNRSVIFPKRWTHRIAKDEHAIRTPDFPRKHNISPVYYDRHSRHSQHVVRFDLEIAAFDEVLRTNLNLHHRVRRPERKVHDLFDHVGLAFDRAFKYPLGQHVIANDIADTISPVG